MANGNRNKLRHLITLTVLTFIFCGVCFAKSEKSPPTATKVLMHRKLVQTQILLQSLMIGNEGNLVKSLQELKTISSATSWYKFNNDVFLRYSSNFRESIDRMIKHQKEGNYEGVSMGYIQLTLTCMNCHQVVRNK